MGRFSIFVSTLILLGCASQPINSSLPTPTPRSTTVNDAHDRLVNFLTLLHAKRYAEATPLYGGDYEQLQVFNTEIDPADHIALWTWACDNQLLKCLEVRSATFKASSGDGFLFQVEFNNPDGSLFVLGPCCGANETEMPPVSQFQYTVALNAEGKFVVMNLPPYVP